MMMAYLKRAGTRGKGAVVAFSVALPLLVAACGSDTGTTGSGGSGGSTGGSGGSTGGKGGSTGGSGGSTGGAAGATGGSGGSTGGSGGTGGSTGGSAGTGGSTGGSAGTGGAAGKDGGTTGGTGGATGGSAGTGGTAGKDGGAGTGGTGGTGTDGGGGTGGGTTDGGAGTGGTGGTGGGTDGGVVVIPPGDPISVPDNTWKAVPTTGAICRDKSATGFAVNLNATSDKLVIYMEGGGACFNATTCSQNPRTWAATDTEAAKAGSKWIMNRSAANNPFKDWNMAYIPYCTGDVHTGTNMSGYMGDAHMGYANYIKYLGKLVATFKAKMPALTRVVLSGSSAGGFGVAWNWMVTEDAFGVPVTAIDDSGPPFASDWLSTCHQQKTGALWGWSGSTHPSCTNCDVAGGNTVIPLMETAMRRQTTRFGFLSYDEDGTIKTFLAYGQNNCANWDALFPPTFASGKYPMGLGDLRTRWMSNPNAAMFVVKGGSHTFLGSDIANTSTGGTSMLDWVNKLLNGDSGWTNVTP